MQAFSNAIFRICSTLHGPSASAELLVISNIPFSDCLEGETQHYQNSTVLYCAPPLFCCDMYTLAISSYRWIRWFLNIVFLNFGHFYGNYLSWKNWYCQGNWQLTQKCQGIDLKSGICRGNVG